ncbi:Putative inner membrane protein [Desulfonatronum zhilinae]|nr:Putative inner membrane protein [Desulfonatronum zhilinae]
MLVRSWREEGAGSESEIRKLLGKRTLARSKDTLVRAFIPRFVHGDPSQAWKILQLLEARNVMPEVLRPLYYWVTARSDRLLYDFVAGELRLSVHSGNGSVRTEETALWIAKQLKFNGQAWSPTVTLKVGRGMLAALRDFGILEGTVKKRVAPVHLPLESFCWIAFWLWRLGSSGESLVRHPDWGLFLLGQTQVETMFLEAHQRNFLDFQSAGRIYRVDFPTESPGAYADDLFGE